MRASKLYLVVLALVSLVFTPPLAANSGLVASAAAGSAGEVAGVWVQAGHFAAGDARDPGMSEGDANARGSFSPSELESLKSMSLSDEQAARHEGAGVVVIGVGGLFVILLLVIIILLLTDTIQVRKTITIESHS